jgi:hypothetical protein
MTDKYQMYVIYHINEIPEAMPQLAKSVEFQLKNQEYGRIKIALKL